MVFSYNEANMTFIIKLKLFNVFNVVLMYKDNFVNKPSRQPRKIILYLGNENQNLSIEIESLNTTRKKEKNRSN